MNKNFELKRYPTEVLTVSDQGFTKHYFIEGQRIASRLGEAFVGEFGARVKADPLEALYRSLPELPDFAVDRLVRDFDCLGADYRNFYPGEPRLDGLERALTAKAYTENDIYFYHSDHLGSSSFITDINGDATQHLQYLPFGEDWVHQQNTAAYYTPYTFSGKERDMETGLSYFGARFYDASLSNWLSVDPMADKYPSLSAYNYCAWNPVMLVDPDGREIYLTGEDANTATSQLQSRSKNLTITRDENTGKISVTGTAKTKFEKQLQAASTNTDYDIRVSTTKSNKTSDGASFFGGAFLGASLNESTGRIDVNYLVNTSVTQSLDEMMKSPGHSMGHEVIEGSLIGEYLLNAGLTSTPRSSEDNPNPIYTNAHEATKGYGVGQDNFFDVIDPNRNSPPGWPLYPNEAIVRYGGKDRFVNSITGERRAK